MILTYDLLEKAKLWTQEKDQWLVGVRDEKGMTRWSMEVVKLFYVVL